MKDLNDYLVNKVDPKDHIKSKPKSLKDESMAAFRDLQQNGLNDFNKFSGAMGPSSAGEDTTNSDFISYNYRYGDDTYDTHEIRANKQSWGAKAGKGVVQFAAKAGLEATKTLGVIGGLITSPFAEGDWTETAFNNRFIKSLEDAENWIDNEFVPVYVKESVQNGGFWDKVTSIDFWATEGADGLGFIAAMFAPGAAIKSLNLGSSLAKAGVKGNKALRALTGRSKYIDDAVESLNKGGKWYGTNAAKIDEGLVTGFNTLSEAGVEAGHAMSDYKADLLEKLKAGEIGFDDYNKGLEDSAELGRNVFLSNVALLTVPNHINTKMLYGKRGSKKLFEANKKIKKRDLPPKLTGAKTRRGKIAQAATNTFNKYKTSSIKKWGDDYLKAFGREGLIEEGGQNTITNYFTKKANKEDDVSFFSEYLNTLGSTEGQIAMFLGTAFGGTMQATTNHMNRRNVDKKYDALVDYANKNIESFTNVLSGNFFKRKEDGKIKMTTDPVSGKPVPELDMKKILKSMQDTKDNRDTLSTLEALILSDRVEEAKSLLDDITTSLVMPFAIEEDLGIEVLKDFLENNESVEAYAQINQITSKEAQQEILEKAKRMKEVHSNYSNYSDVMIDFEKYKEDLSDEEFDEMRSEVRGLYLHMKGKEGFLEENRERVERELSNIYKELGIENDPTEDNKGKKKTKDKRIESLEYEKKQIEEAIQHNKDAIEAIWDGSTLDKYYKNKKKSEKSEEELEEGAKKADELIKKIQNVSTLKELSDLNDEEAAKFSHDMEIINSISQSIKEDYSQENLEKQLKRLKEKLGSLPLEEEALQNLKMGEEEPTIDNINSNSPLRFFNGYEIQRILEEQIEEIKNRKKDFLKVMDSILQELDERNKSVNEKLKNSEKELKAEIKALETLRESFNKALETTPSVGRGAKFYKDLIEQDKKRIKELESNIKELKARVEELNKEKEEINSKLEAFNSDAIFSALVNEEFVGIRDFKDYILGNLNKLENTDTGIFAEMSPESLLTNRLYVDEEIQNTEEAIKALEENLKAHRETLKIKESLLKEIESRNQKKKRQRKRLAKDISDTSFAIRQLEKRLDNSRAELIKLKNKRDQIKIEQTKEADINNLTTILNTLRPFKEFESSEGNIMQSNQYVNRVLRNREEKLRAQQKEVDRLKKENAERNQEKNDQDFLLRQEAYNKISNLVEGDVFTLNKELFKDVYADKVLSSELIFKSINPKTGTITAYVGKEGGSKIYISKPKSGVNKPVNKPNTKETSTNTEGGYTDPVTVVDASEILEGIEEIETLPTEESNARLGITMGDGVNPIHDVPESSIGYERNGKNKQGDFHDITIMDKSEIKASGEQADKLRKAIDEYNKNGVTSDNIDQLIDYLPIKLNLTDSSYGLIFTKPSSNTGTYKNTSRKLRERIFQELLHGKAVKDINIKIAGQKHGNINIAPKKDGKVVENNIADMKEFGSNIDNIASDDIFVVNGKGTLQNNKGEYFTGNVNRKLAPGEIYLSVKLPSGKNFPLKLNIQRPSEEQAEAVFELFKHRLLTEDDSEGKSALFIDLPQETQDRVKELLGDDLRDLAEVSNETVQRLTLKDIIDFYVWDGSKNPKTKMYVSRKYGHIAIGGKKISKKDIDNETSKKRFIDFVTNNNNNNEGKRRNIQFKDTKSGRPLHFGNRKYVEYLIKNNILNTNVDTSKDTFTGDTSMYLDNNIYLGKDKTPSEYNQKKVIKAKRGTKSQLFNILPSLGSKRITLNPQSNFYIDPNLKETKGNRSRVSSLYREKSKETFDMENNEASYMGAKRGDVIDELVREFFEKRLTFENFKKKGKQIIKNVNETKNKFKKVEFTEEALASVYNILLEYDNYFSENNMTIFSFENVLWNNEKFGNFGGKTKGYFAGTTDLLAYDNTTKEWVIIDIKSSSTELEKIYSGEIKDRYNVKEKYGIQQNAYIEMFEQITGERPKAYILPLKVQKPDIIGQTKYTYDSVTKSDKMLLEVDSSEDIYSLLGIKKEEKKSSYKPKTSNEGSESPTTTTSSSTESSVRKSVDEIIDAENSGEIKENRTSDKPLETENTVIESDIFTEEELNEISDIIDRFLVSYKNPNVKRLSDNKDAEPINIKEYREKYEITNLNNYPEELQQGDTTFDKNKTFLINFNGKYALVKVSINSVKPKVIYSDSTQIGEILVDRNKSKQGAIFDIPISDKGIREVINTNRKLENSSKPTKSEESTKKVENNEEKIRKSQKKSVPLPKEDSKEDSTPKEEPPVIEYRESEDDGPTREELEELEALEELERRQNEDTAGAASPFGSDPFLQDSENDGVTSENRSVNVEEILNIDSMTEEEAELNLEKITGAYMDILSTDPVGFDQLTQDADSDLKGTLKKVIEYLKEKHDISENEIENICK